MGLRKGQTNNPSGRKVGSKNKRTEQWEALGNAIKTVHAQRFNDILSTLDDEKFIVAFKDILNYFQPKLTSTQADITTGGEKLNITPKDWI